MVAKIRDFMSGYGWPVLVAVTLFVLGAVFETKIELVQLKQEVQSLREDIQEVKTEIKEIHAILYINFNSEYQTGVDGHIQARNYRPFGSFLGHFISENSADRKKYNFGKINCFRSGPRSRGREVKRWPIWP